MVALPGGDNDNFYRNVCSAILDAPLYPEFAATPFLVRRLFAALAVVAPGLRVRLLAACLWVQLRVMYYANDYWTYQGRLPITVFWDGWPFGPHAPLWAQRLQWNSMLLFSRVVLAACFWVGTLVLGMKPEYAEYTVHRRAVTEK